MKNLLLFISIPVAALIISAGIALLRAPRDSLISIFQHFAAGTIFSAVALELLPRLHAAQVPVAMTLGFIAGVVAMLVIKQLSRKAGMVAPIAVDLFIDGMLVAIGFAAGVKGGMILLVGLTMETFSLGLSTAPTLQKSGLTRLRISGLMVALGAVLLLGSLFGDTIIGGFGALIDGILSFGVAALLYLVTEELLIEAHKTKDTPLVTAMFFLGFLVPLLLAL